MLCLLSVFCFMLVFEKIRFVKPGWPGFAGHCQGAGKHNSRVVFKKSTPGTIRHYPQISAPSKLIQNRLALRDRDLTSLTLHPSHVSRLRATRPRSVTKHDTKAKTLAVAFSCS